MEVHKLKDMFKGWFVGNFEPTVLKTNDVEIGVKEYEEGEYEDFHHHRIATELTCIIEGEVEMNGKRYCAGDIIVIPPKEGTDFRAITKAKNVVVKFPGANDDKYIGEYKE
jgi:ethanolamine utilization protein EutQ (cupin superfamily)